MALCAECCYAECGKQAHCTHAHTHTHTHAHTHTHTHTQSNINDRSYL